MARQASHTVIFIYNFGLVLCFIHFIDIVGAIVHTRTATNACIFVYFYFYHIYAS